MDPGRVLEACPRAKAPPPEDTPPVIAREYIFDATNRVDQALTRNRNDGTLQPCCTSQHHNTSAPPFVSSYFSLTTFIPQ